MTGHGIPSHIRHEMDSILGQPCCRQHVGDEHRYTLFLGFGGTFVWKIGRKEVLYGQWDFGSRWSDWRIVENNRIVCGSNDSFDSVDEFQPHLDKLSGVACVHFRMLTEYDIRVVLDNGMCVDYLPTFSDDDKAFHLFLPGRRRVIEFSVSGGWVAKDLVPLEDV